MAGFGQRDDELTAIVFAALSFNEPAVFQLGQDLGKRAGFELEVQPEFLLRHTPAPFFKEAQDGGLARSSTAMEVQVMAAIAQAMQDAHRLQLARIIQRFELAGQVFGRKRARRFVHAHRPDEPPFF